MKTNKEVNKMTHDLGQLATTWSCFVIRNGILFTPNGYRYPPGYIYSIPIGMQQIANYEYELRTPKQLPIHSAGRGLLNDWS